MLEKFMVAMSSPHLTMLREQADKEGTSVGELVRRAVHLYVQQLDPTGEWLMRVVAQQRRSTKRRQK